MQQKCFWFPAQTPLLPIFSASARLVQRPARRWSGFSARVGGSRLDHTTGALVRLRNRIKRPAPMAPPRRTLSTGCSRSVVSRVVPGEPSSLCLYAICFGQPPPVFGQPSPVFSCFGCFSSPFFPCVRITALASRGVGRTCIFSLFSLGASTTD